MSDKVQYTKDQTLQYMRDVIAAKGIAPTRDDFREISDIPERQWRRFYSSYTDYVDAASESSANQSEPIEKNTFTADTWDVEIGRTSIHTLDELLEYCKVDLSIWEVEKFTVNTWQMGYLNSVGIADAHPLYQVKAILKRRVEVVNARKELEALKIEFKKTAPFAAYASERHLPTGNVLEINVPDSHFGKLAWGKETGDRSYDTPIAAATFLRAIKELVYLSSGFVYDKIVFVVGNDLLNSDDEMGRTTKGTYVATDGRYKKTFAIVRQTIREAIELLRKIAPVEVYMVSGNHDNLGVWHLGDSLDCIYENYEDVTVHNEPTQRKYFRYGKVLLMFSHGDKGKREDYPLLMATERSKDFGETKYREIHTGHIHQTKTQEWHGVRVRILPSLSPPDVWHSENGFTGQQRNAEAYVWNDQYGLIAQFFYNDDAWPEITTDRITKEG